MYQYKCLIVHWLDGDTCAVKIDLGFDVWLSQKVRVFGLNCPEIHSKNQEEKRQGTLAKSHAELLAPVGSVLVTETAKAGKSVEKYGRYLAKITLKDGRDFAQAMIDAGHAKEYHGGKR